MKKTFLAIVAIAATSASAASFTWKVSSVQFNGATLTAGPVTASLIYLGNGASLAESYNISSLDVVASYTTGASVSKGNITPDDSYVLPVANASANGDVYTVLLSYANGGKTYYNLSSYTYTVAGVSDESWAGTTYNVAKSNQNYSMATPSASIKAGGGWTAVPEPSTAMLALAGLALLIKRRRA